MNATKLRKLTRSTRVTPVSLGLPAEIDTRAAW